MKIKQVKGINPNSIGVRERCKKDNRIDELRLCLGDKEVEISRLKAEIQHLKYQLSQFGIVI